MKVVSASPLTGEHVSIDSDPDNWTEYIRYSADNWYCWMGESLEPFYPSEELEAAYQVYKCNTPSADMHKDLD